MISIVVVRIQGDNDGLTKTQGMVIGITQLLCLGVCVLALLAAAYSLIAKKKLPYKKNTQHIMLCGKPYHRIRNDIL
ncbi:hypothetical protein [Ruminococcus flavefaciens]|uniref:hypothetical protein n=1 Tax=Ruminococcus flavefaciens TaxID=1265 RepID=UPI000464BCE8|nr:hypothetical protein [Ruminococcus flavefaciens]